ncbi:flagellar export chaperone FliS [Clostridium aminobutyricum]|uniref:Flagellar protein FliS n=1 Tax=Clostridium aminobutyricum TaxID=33953 RepID=A0A939D9J6_CLOAM|nr:flagellar export chaperone FliS [Clostridium aminobutyricum]MBN7773716.1 flagellar protein FliS [Clostridium aminobutyricum]
MISYGYQQYKAQSVETMTKGEMLILLYDEINKRLLRAKKSLAEGEVQLFEADVQRAIDIVRYLIKSLDRRYPISNDLYRMYDFINFDLSRLKSGRNLSIIDEITPLVKDLRDTFKEADRLAKNSVNAVKSNPDSSVG